MNLKDTYNKIAKDWFNDHKENDWWTADAEEFLKHLKPGDRILDVGCGAGLKTKYLVEKGFKVVGVDFSEEMIKLAKEYCPAGEFYVKDVKEPLNLELFDGVFAQAVLLHIPKKEALNVLRNLCNALKPQGYFWLVTKELKPGEREEQNIVENDYNYQYERFFSFFTIPELKGYFQELDMEVIYQNTISRGEINWIVMIAKK